MNPEYYSPEIAAIFSKKAKYHTFLHPATVEMLLEKRAADDVAGDNSSNYPWLTNGLTAAAAVPATAAAGKFARNSVAKAFTSHLMNNNYPSNREIIDMRKYFRNYLNNAGIKDVQFMTPPWKYDAPGASFAVPESQRKSIFNKLVKLERQGLAPWQDIATSNANTFQKGKAIAFNKQLDGMADYLTNGAVSIGTLDAQGYKKLFQKAHVYSPGVNPYALAHEVGHHLNDKTMSRLGALSKPVRGIATASRIYTSLPPSLVAGIAPAIASFAPKDSTIGQYAWTLPLAMSAPTLFGEGLASIRGLRALSKMKGGPKMMGGIKSLGLPFLNYAAAPVIGSIGAYLANRMKPE